MNNIDEKILRVVGGNHNIHSYLDIPNRNHFSQILPQIINQDVPNITKIHTKEDEDLLKEKGYIVFDNYLNNQEINDLRSYLDKQSGYNTHTPKYSDKVLRKLTSEYNYNNLSFSSNILLNHPLIPNKISDPYILSLVQSYLGCFPTVYSINSWWSIYNGQVYGTQNNHRDHDDFKFLAFFIYLTDVDETTGPHVFYPGTQNGSESDEHVVITGKAGTAILADTFAMHRGQPLQQNSRLVCWWRYGLYLNNMYYFNEENVFKTPYNTIFSNIPNTLHNEYLFRAFY
jgi:hypothetical protein